MEQAAELAFTGLRTRAELRQCLQIDLNAYGFSRWHWWMRLKRPQLHFQRILRRVEYLQTQSGPLAKLGYAVCRVRLALTGQRLGFSIPPGVFGPGLTLPHYGTIVVNDKARFGRYCRLHTSTNIGESAGFAPTGGDFVYIAPGSVLYGQLHVGDEALIGANSVVNTDVPAGTTVAGAPAKVINERKGSRAIMPPSVRQHMP